MKKRFGVVAVLALVGMVQVAMGDERVLPGAVLKAMGFVPVRAPHALHRLAAPFPTGLSWPIPFQDEAHTIAQNYVNFQDYGGEGPYFHKGCDLRTDAHSWVTTPVEGVLEGGYYGYDTQADGSETKYWNAWNGDQHPDPYFELAIITDAGYRLEFHHVDVMELPADTIDALNRGGVRIAAGTRIGHTLSWPDGVYHHIHFNLFSPDGTHLNPEVHMVAPPDHVAPKIQGVYAIDSSSRVTEVREGATISSAQEIVVATTESRDHDAYVQTPPFAELAFADGKAFRWDFREQFKTETGGFPDIRKVFMTKLRTPSGQTLKTVGQYGKGLFLMRLPVPAGAQGAFTVRVGDTAGNESKVSGSLR